MHKMDWWFDPMISSYSFDSLLLLLLPLLLLLLFLFLRRLKLTASLLSFLLRWKFHFHQFWKYLLLLLWSWFVCLSLSFWSVPDARIHRQKLPTSIVLSSCYFLSLVRFPTVTVGGKKCFFGIDRRSINNHLRSTRCCTIKPCRLVSCSFSIHKRLAIFGFDLLPLP